MVGPHLTLGKCSTSGTQISSSVSLSILLLATLGEKLIGPYVALPVGKWAVNEEQAAWNKSYVAYITN